jgi:hypothetical protein
VAGDIIAFKPVAPTPEQSSARLRCYRPCKYLSSAGWKCEIFDPRRMDRYRVVVFQKAYTPNDLDIAEHLRGLGVRTVFDLCDNHLYVPDDRPDFRERADRLRRMIDRVDAVSVATPELAKIIDRSTVVIDDALDDVPLDWWSPARAVTRRWRARRPLRLIWFGNAGESSPPFGLIDLARLLPVLQAVHAQSPLSLTIVSNSRTAFEKHLAGAQFPVQYHDWVTSRFVRLFRRHDLCLIPVNVNPFTICKTVNRLALSLLLGVPAIADWIPSYEELRDGASFGNWEQNLSIHATDAIVGQRQVRAAQAYLRAKYTRHRVVQQWADLLRPLAA